MWRFYISILPIKYNIFENSLSRPKKFNGSWYSSLFIHYYPVDWDGHKVQMDSHFRVPSIWAITEPKDPDLDELVTIESSYKEPACKDHWCALENSVKWYGPAPGYGKVLTAGGLVHELDDIPQENEFEELREFHEANTREEDEL